MGDKEAVGALGVALIVWMLGTLVTGTTYWPVDLMFWLGCEVLVEQAASCQ